MIRHSVTTAVVGRYPQPDWLIDRAMLSRGLPRVRLRAMRRVPEAFLERARDETTLVAIRDMERAGIDIVSDGEMRRESYSNRFGDRRTVRTPSRRARPAMAPGARSAGLYVGEALG